MHTVYQVPKKLDFSFLLIPKGPMIVYDAKQWEI